MPPKPKSSAEKKLLKDPKGGLTAAGRAHFKETEGANLKPGVKGPADTPEKQKRKGSFLRRHFANPQAGPLQDDKGEPTRHALSAAAWGEPVPSNEADVKKLADKGSELLEQYHGSQGAKSTKRASEMPTKAEPATKSASVPSKAKPAAKIATRSPGPASDSKTAASNAANKPVQVKATVKPAGTSSKKKK